jgi:hypothetical protein
MNMCAVGHVPHGAQNVGNIHRAPCADDVACGPFGNGAFAPIVLEPVAHERIVSEGCQRCAQVEGIGCRDVGRYGGDKRSRGWGRMVNMTILPSEMPNRQRC